MKKVVKDNIVKHEVFGKGKVLEASNLNKVTVHFVEDGPKLLNMQYAKLKILTGDNAIDPILDNLGNTEKE